ncbi:MAG: aspartate-semialdehyde dehydrogenase [Leptospiraceae bacterium]|nr:aspartate-semialdehyde dehydrogenase [Leptospiraceae bacterium]MDW7975061.1 aspartate-semialdehyde dehydrogenase [Leptospiraceae bacterium]
MSKTIAIVGATGAVGMEFLKVLEKRNFPIKELKLYASKRSAGKKLTFKGEEIPVEVLSENSFHNVEIALFSAGASVSKQFAPAAVALGTVVVDNSSAFRMDPEVPLVVPEINAEEIKNHKGIIANPNCSTIIMLIAIYPIHKLYNVKKIIVSTYQAASGAGASAMYELEEQAKAFLEKKEVPIKVLPYQLAFNLFSHNSAVDLESGYNQEEIKMIKETKKILNQPDIQVSPTCIRVSTFRAHAESITLELEKPADLEEIKEAYRNFPSVRLVDDRQRNYFPMPLDATGIDEVLVGRLRYDFEDKERKRIHLFAVGDQLLKGAALNAVQIAEYLK